MQQFLQKSGIGKHTKNRLQGKLTLQNMEKCSLDLDLCHQLSLIDFKIKDCKIDLSIDRSIKIRDDDIISNLGLKNAIRLRSFALELLNFKLSVSESSSTTLKINISSKRKADHLDNDFSEIYQPCSIKYEILHDTLYLGARYNKLVRTLSQTPFFIKGERKGDNSVSEIIGNHFSNLVGSSDYNMISSGREDLNVRCLGRGRPFIIELKNPTRTNFNWDDEQKSFNLKNSGLVQLHYLTDVPKASLTIIKNGEESKCKHYECDLAFSQSLSEDDIIALNRLDLPLKIQQQTPVRVVHRRANLVREKLIHSFKLDGKRLLLKTSAGMYIKEFVHGDLGRTKPSLRDLIKQYCEKELWCDINNLDIVDVDMEWPPK
eukprot:NODE_271_length_11194_cov_0.541595.p2 type:complete len:375 gc:universal NODE_271_length_11194_cov_0.541595:968-2092(+)